MRSKLKLDLDQLAVDSFGTTEEAAQGGTVFGEQCTCWTNCDTCPGCPTCDGTCGGNTCGGTCGENTCNASCNGTCYDWTCGGDCWGTQYDATCKNYGTCHYNSPCQIVP